MSIRLVVTDMDNTLYSWIDYIVPAVEAMVDAVQLSTGFPRVKVVQSLKAVYTKHESNEYPFALQDEPARMAFSAARKKYLRPYKGVLETLAQLKARGVTVVALTDAPRNPAEQRVRRMELDQFLAGLYTMPGFHFPKGPDGEALVAPDILQRAERGAYKPRCPTHELPRECEKPNPAGLERILKDHGAQPHEVLVVGDSVKKDVGVAKKVGCHDAWAEYGTYVSLEYRERLDIISSPAITRRHAAHVFEQGEQPVAPTHTLSNFSQVLKLVETL